MIVESVRPARGSDAAVWRELMGLLVASSRDHRGRQETDMDSWTLGPSGPPLDDLGALLAHPSSVVLMGCLDAVPVALAVAEIGKPAEGERTGYLYLCFVEEGARQVGLGRLLVDEVLTVLRESGCTSVDGWALPGDRATKNQFESAGFKARLITMHRKLGPAETKGT